MNAATTVAAATIAETSAAATVVAARTSRRTDQLIATLTVQLEGDVIDCLFVETVRIQDALEGTSEAQRVELTVEYRHLVLQTNGVLKSKAECYAILRGT